MYSSFRIYVFFFSYLCILIFVFMYSLMIFKWYVHSLFCMVYVRYVWFSICVFVLVSMYVVSCMFSRLVLVCPYVFWRESLQVPYCVPYMFSCIVPACSRVSVCVLMCSGVDHCKYHTVFRICSRVLFRRVLVCSHKFCRASLQAAYSIPYVLTGRIMFRCVVVCCGVHRSK